MTEIKKSMYSIEVLLSLSRYQPSHSNERINTKTNTYKQYTYFAILFCLFVLCLIKNEYNKIKSTSIPRNHHVIIK